MIVETTDNRKFEIVGEVPGAPQCWLGIEVRRVAVTHGIDRAWAPKKNARQQLVRKAGCRIVQEG